MTMYSVRNKRTGKTITVPSMSMVRQAILEAANYRDTVEITEHQDPPGTVRTPGPKSP